jgi:hypothetical protein
MGDSTLGIPWPDENENPFIDTIENGTKPAIDDVKEDGDLLFNGGGTFTLVGDLLTWDEPMVISSPRAGTAITVAANSQTLLDGNVIVITPSARPIPDETLTVTSATVAAFGTIPLIRRIGTSIQHRFVKDGTDHLQLTNLNAGLESDGGHTNAALLVGRAGGQNIKGGTLAGQDLSFTDNAVDSNTTTLSEISGHIADTANPHSVTKTQVNLGNVTDDAQLKRAGSDWSGFTEDTNPQLTDLVLTERSSDGAKRKVQRSNLAGGLDHTQLQNLNGGAGGDGGHSVLTRLSGRSTGQIIHGGTSTSEDLVLKANTADATQVTVQELRAFMDAGLFDLLQFNTAFTPPSEPEGQVWWDFNDYTLRSDRRSSRETICRQSKRFDARQD